MDFLEDIQRTIKRYQELKTKEIILKEILRFYQKFENTKNVFTQLDQNEKIFVKDFFWLFDDILLDFTNLLDVILRK